MPRGAEEAAPAASRAAQFSMSLCCQVTSARPGGNGSGQPSAQGGGALSHKRLQVSSLYRAQNKTLLSPPTNSSFSGWTAGGFCCVKT